MVHQHKRADVSAPSKKRMTKWRWYKSVQDKRTHHKGARQKTTRLKNAEQQCKETEIVKKSLEKIRL